MNWLRAFVLGCVGAALVVLAFGARAQSSEGREQLNLYVVPAGTWSDVELAADGVACLVVVFEDSSQVEDSCWYTAPGIEGFYCTSEAYNPASEQFERVETCRLTVYGALVSGPGGDGLTESTFIDWVQFLAGGLGCLVFAAGWHLGKGLG